MNAVLRLERVGAACRMFFMSLAMMAGLLFALPSEAQPQAPSNAAEPIQGGGLPANIPVKREQSSEMSAGASDPWWIVVVIAGGLIAFAVVVARRRVQPARGRGPWWRRLGGFFDAVPSHEIQRVSSMPLSPRHSLHVVVWNERRLLLGCTDQGIQLLAEAPATSKNSDPASVVPENAQ